MKKILITILLFYILIIFQQSFLSHFTFWGGEVNLALLGVFLLNLFERENHQSVLSFEPRWIEKNFGILAGFLAGIILDLFSSFPFGVFALNLTVSVLFLKKISRRFQKSNILGVSFLFLSFFCFQKVFLMFEKIIVGFFLERNFWLFLSFNLMSLFAEFCLMLFFILLVFIFAKKYGFFRV